MILSSTRTGLIEALRRPGLAGLLWLWNAALALALAVPIWTWWRGSTALAPEADALLTRFRFGVFADLVRSDSSLTTVVSMFWAVALLALAGQAFIAGGTIEALAAGDGRSLLHRFGRGAGRFFWRFLRVAIAGGLFFIVVAAVLTAGFTPLGRALEDVDWEPAWYLGQAAWLFALGVVGLLTVLALDYARIRMAKDDSRRAIRAFFGAVRFVAIHPLATIGLWLVITLLSAAVFGVYLAYSGLVPAVTWGTIVLMAAVQQVTIWLRAGLRVAMVAGELDVWAGVGVGSRVEVRGSPLAARPGSPAVGPEEPPPVEPPGP